MRSSRRFSSSGAFAATVAAMVLLPYLTVGLELRSALLAQAGGIVFLLALLGLGLALRKRPGRELFQGPLAKGALAYGAAGVLGLIVGLAHGNSLTLIAGQFLSIALLPLAFVIGRMVPEGARARSFALALSASAGAATLLHLAAWAHALMNDDRSFRFVLDNSVTLSGSALMALLAALALTGSERRRTRLLAFASALLAGVFIVGSGVRGLWIVTPVALLIFALSLGYGGRRLRRTALASLLLLVAASAAIWWGFQWLEKPRPDLFKAKGLAIELFDKEIISFTPRDMRFPHLKSRQMRRDARRRAKQAERKTQKRGRTYRSNVPVHFGWAAGHGEAIFLKREVENTGTYRLSAKVKGGSPGARGSLIARWLDPDGARLGELALAVRPSKGWRRVTAIGVAPAGSTHVELVGAAWDGKGIWLLDVPRLEHLASPVPAAALGRLDYFRSRARSLASLFSAEGAEDERSLAIRLAESRTVLGLFGEAPLGTKLSGRGLGATFRVPDHAAVAPAVDESAGEQNYIHNYYVFLVWKLGLLGTALVLFALGSWVVTTRRWLAARPIGVERRFLAAAVAGWAAYLILSLSSPEILDFRIAPLWGFLLAATHACRPREPGEDPAG